MAKEKKNHASGLSGVLGLALGDESSEVKPLEDDPTKARIIKRSTSNTIVGLTGSTVFGQADETLLATPAIRLLSQSSEPMPIGQALVTIGLQHSHYFEWHDPSDPLKGGDNSSSTWLGPVIASGTAKPGKQGGTIGFYAAGNISIEASAVDGLVHAGALLLGLGHDQAASYATKDRQNKPASHRFLGFALVNNLAEQGSANINGVRHRIGPKQQE